MSEALAVVSAAGGIGRIRLNRADKRNAINAALATEIIDGMTRLDADDSVVVIVIEGTDGSFCAGADMTETVAAREAGDSRFNPTRMACDRVAASPKPTIAAIDGPAYGGGAALACSCDLRVLSERGRFRFPGAEYGLVVGAVALPQLVGPALAKELIFTARPVEAEEALRVGLANRVVPQPQFEATVDEIAKTIAAASPLALQWSKAVVNATMASDGPRVEHQADLILRGGADHIERFGRAAQRVTGRGGSNA